MDNRALAQRSGDRLGGSVRCLISVVDGPSFKGVASSFSANGLYIEVAGDLLPGRNAEVDIFLRESRNTPELHLRGVVARRSNRQDRTTDGQVGVGVRISEAPVEYHALFKDSPAKASVDRQVCSPHPLVIYDGNSLDDVFDLLQEMGAEPRRGHVAGRKCLESWTEVPKLVLVDAADALTLELPEEADRQGVLRVAIAASKSEILGNLLRRLGYQYLIRRPLHRDAIQILLRNLLHQGQTRRESARVALGVDAKIQARPWAWNRPCSLLDLSRGGCLLATPRRLPLRRRVKLVIGREVTGDRNLSLTGHVIRRRYDDASGEWQVALRFHPPADAQGVQVSRLLQRTTLGPGQSLQPTRMRRLGALAQRLFGLGRKLVPLPGHLDRRRDLRARFDRHVCKLDESGTRVTALLAGYDLTSRGMRVQPHPELELGTHVSLSLHDHARQRPIELTAEVIRDDGADGLGLRFIDLDADVAARIEALVSALPAAHSLVMAGIESSVESIAAR
jgi:hypothetical protein